MKNVLNRRPEHPLPPGRHQKLRAELLDAIETEEIRTPHRKLAPVAAAAAVLAVAAGVAIAVPALRYDDGAPVAGKAPAQPAIRELPAADIPKLRSQCLAEANRITANGHKRPFADYKIVRAFEFVDVKDPKVVSTWLRGEGVAVIKNPRDIPPERVPYTWFCSRTAGGVISESSVRWSGPAQLMGAPIHLMARNAGVYTKPVARVTVQPKGKAPIEALVRDGFWFAPTEGRTNWGPSDADDPERDDYVVRTYDAAGHELYSTAEPKPTAPITCPVPLMPSRSTAKPPTPTTTPACRVYHWPS